jgi:hypothetical protein
MPGFRTREVLWVTTLLDSAQYPPLALGQLYYRRWAMELSLRNLKCTLQMEHLSCKTPENLERAECESACRKRGGRATLPPCRPAGEKNALC